MRDVDFPPFFIKMIHPDDYQVTNSLTNPEFIIHRQEMHHTRLIARLCFTSSNEHNSKEFTTISFIINTCAPRYFYLSLKAIETLKKINRIVIDDMEQEYIQINGKKFPIEETPRYQYPANIIGLNLLLRMGFHLQGDTFTFNSDFLGPL